jgi:curved DNA-binding protein
MSVQFKDYYATLGVPRDAGHDVIKKAFRKLARKYHPDVAKDKSTAEEKFKEINEAFEVLGDPEKREKYDRLGAHWRDAEGGGFYGAPPEPGGGHGQEFHFGGTGFSDFFEQYFSGGTRFGFPPGEGGGFAPAGGAQSTARVRRGGDVEGDILVTLDEVMHGTLRSISMQTVNRQTGEVSTQTFQVRIPPGATDGRRIRVPGHGEPGHGGAPAGDLFLRVRHAAHPDFSSQQADLYHDLDIAPWEAVLGAEVVVPSLDGAIKLRIPAGAENGQHLRVRGRGLPKGRTGERGDFFVVLQVQLPTAPGSAERALWEKLRDISTFHPRASR